MAETPKVSQRVSTLMLVRITQGALTYSPRADRCYWNPEALSLVHRTLYPVSCLFVHF